MRLADRERLASQVFNHLTHQISSGAYEAGEDAAFQVTGQAASAATEALRSMGTVSAPQASPSGSHAPALQDSESTLVPSEDQGSSPDRDKTVTAAGDRRDSSS